jgi:hypothetical protein
MNKSTFTNLPLSRAQNATKMSASHFDIITVNHLDKNIVEKIEKGKLGNIEQVKVELTKLQQAQYDAKTKLAEELAAKKEKDDLLQQAKVKGDQEAAAKKEKEIAEYRVKKYQLEEEKAKEQEEKAKEQEKAKEDQEQEQEPKQ